MPIRLKEQRILRHESRSYEIPSPCRKTAELSMNHNPHDGHERGHGGEDESRAIEARRARRSASAIEDAIDSGRVADDARLATFSRTPRPRAVASCSCSLLTPIYCISDLQQCLAFHLPVDRRSVLQFQRVPFAAPLPDHDRLSPQQPCSHCILSWSRRNSTTCTLPSRRTTAHADPSTGVVEGRRKRSARTERLRRNRVRRVVEVRYERLLCLSLSRPRLLSPFPD
ncbi:hypothetical protein PYCCODRAFT_941137 [Trametes coccinea BRFM310]|uniref:Uncharacterized protein n=1 Tax=Trametes coccinea (strain BRFM310) TaxID=1353009 RepID=A0A1Y2J119_TRAC3|nr:hypothetical protein PYCCODRAFT_941137 [Trametes coccinea BRFM310]